MAEGLVTRTRSLEDERNVIVTLTDKGVALKQKALSIPEQICKCIGISQEDAQTLYRILYQILGDL